MVIYVQISDDEANDIMELPMRPQTLFCNISFQNAFSEKLRVILKSQVVHYGMLMVVLLSCVLLLLVRRLLLLHSTNPA